MFRAVLAAALLCASAASWSQAYPARAVRIVVPFAVGGSADVYGRFLAAKLTDSLGQPFVVENRPGGGAVVGTDAVAKSAPDGYTLLVMSNTHTVNETLIPKKPYDLMKDLAPITGINYQDLMLVIHPSVQANNLRELIAMAKAYPGRLFYASSGPGYAVPHGRRAIQIHGGRGYRARAAQGLGPGAHRRARRAGAHDV
jgi:tripartite-type tricarboxylate transporter receptor subunit TctC